MDISVLIPWRTDNGPRQEALDYLLPKWRETGAEICIGVDPGEGPFNCSRAQNRAFRLASHNKLVMYGADQLPDLDVLLDASARLDKEPWLPLYNKTGYYSRGTTARLLAGEPLHAAPLEYVLPFCTGLVGLSRDAYRAVGGMDERFEGWGYEDAAFRLSLECTFGFPESLDHTLRCLWHETGHRIEQSPNQVLMIKYLEAANGIGFAEFLKERGSFLD